MQDKTTPVGYPVDKGLGSIQVVKVSGRGKKQTWTVWEFWNHPSKFTNQEHKGFNSLDEAREYARVLAWECQAAAAESDK